MGFLLHAGEVHQYVKRIWGLILMFVVFLLRFTSWSEITSRDGSRGLTCTRFSCDGMTSRGEGEHTLERSQLVSAVVMGEGLV